MELHRGLDGDGLTGIRPGFVAPNTPQGHSSWRTTTMAKALFGHVGSGNDLRLSYEVRRLRARVAELEAELAHTRAVNDALVGVDVPEDVRELEAEPVLT